MTQVNETQVEACEKLAAKWEREADEGTERARKGEYTVHPLMNPGTCSHALRYCADELRAVFSESNPR